MTLSEVQSFCAAGGFVAMVGPTFAGKQIRKELDLPRKAVILLPHRADLALLLDIAPARLRFMEVGEDTNLKLLRGVNDFARRYQVGWLSLYRLREEAAQRV